MPLRVIEIEEKFEELDRKQTPERVSAGRMAGEIVGLICMFILLLYVLPLMFMALDWRR